VGSANISLLSGNGSHSLTSLGIRLTIVVIADLFYCNIVGFLNLLVFDLFLILHGSNRVLLNSGLYLVLHDCHGDFKVVGILSWLHGLYGYLVNSRAFNIFVYCDWNLFNSCYFFWFHDCDWYHLGVIDSSIFHLGNWYLLSPLILLVLHVCNWDHFCSHLCSSFHICDGNLNGFIYLLLIHVSDWDLDLLGHWYGFNSGDWLIINGRNWIFLMVSRLVLSDLVISWTTGNGAWGILSNMSIGKWSMCNCAGSILSNMGLIKGCCAVGSWSILTLVISILSRGDGAWSILTVLWKGTLRVLTVSNSGWSLLMSIVLMTSLISISWSSTMWERSRRLNSMIYVLIGIGV